MTTPLYNAIKKSLTGRFSTYIIQFSTLAIYARIFTPDQFGIIASLQVFVLFFQVLADIGIGPAIINEKQFTKAQRDGVFSVTLLLGIVLAVTFYLFSYFLNSFYTGYQYQKLAVIVSASIMFYSLNIVPVTALNKDSEFIKLAKADSLSEVFSLSVVYTLYILDFGVFALASKTLAHSFLRFILTRHMSIGTSLGKPSFGSELFHIKKLASFALYQFGFNFINYFSRNLDNILVAKYIGTSSLGVYEKSYQLMRYPLMLTTFAMTPAIQPILTKVRDDVDKVVAEHNKLAMRLLFISLLISSFIYINSHNVVLILFGEQWLKVVPLIEIFSFMIPIQAVLSTSGPFYQVMNKPNLLFFSGAMSAVINIISIVFGVYLGELKYVAFGLLFGFSISFVQCYYLMFKYCFKRSAVDFYIGLLKAIILAVFPVSIYTLSWVKIINHIPQEVFVNFFFSAFLAILILGIFIKPIKNTLR